MGECLLTSAYLPPVEWFCRLYSHDKAYIEQWDTYMKQTYRNRAVIDSPNGSLSLSIPVSKPSGKPLMKDVRISDHGNWRHIHWEALKSSYSQTPFFEFYQDDFQPFYEKKWEFLIDYNEALLMKCCELIDLEPNISLTERYEKTENLPSSITDCRLKLNKGEVSGTENEFIPKEYYQVFSHKHGFKANLSIVDLLFNMGPESLVVLRDSLIRV